NASRNGSPIPPELHGRSCCSTRCTPLERPPSMGSPAARAGGGKTATNESVRNAGDSARLVLRELLRRVVFGLVGILAEALLERPNALAEPFADAGKARRTEEEENDDEDDDPVYGAERSHAETSGRRRTRAGFRRIAREEEGARVD